MILKVTETLHRQAFLYNAVPNDVLLIRHIALCLHVKCCRPHHELEEHLKTINTVTNLFNKP